VRVIVQPLWLPKLGNRPEQYEDACWPRRRLCREAQLCRFAIADGATESAFSGLWARMLVRAFVRGKLGAPDETLVLARLQREWLRQVTRTELPWYLEEKVYRGAFSSLTGLTLACDASGLTEGVWSATAVGDSCLFQISDGRLALAWPIDRSDLFGSRPVLVASVSIGNVKLGEHVKSISGNWRTGDEFYLMTDAIGSWFIREVEGGRAAADLAREVDSIGGQASFEKWVAGLHESRKLRNDDITLLRIRVD